MLLRTKSPQELLRIPILLVIGILLLSYAAYPQSKTDRSEGKVLPYVVFAPKPAYPTSARAARTAGTVRIDVKFDTEGKIVSARFVEGHTQLREPTLKAARKWRFNKVDGSIGIRGVRLTFVFFTSVCDFVEMDRDDVVYKYRIHLTYSSDHLVCAPEPK